MALEIPNNNLDLNPLLIALMLAASGGTGYWAGSKRNKKDSTSKTFLDETATKPETVTNAETPMQKKTLPPTKQGENIQNYFNVNKKPWMQGLSPIQQSIQKKLDALRNEEIKKTIDILNNYEPTINRIYKGQAPQMNQPETTWDQNLIRRKKDEGSSSWINLLGGQ